MIIEKWMGEEDDLLRIRVRSLAELKQDIPCATREKLAGEKERIETYIKRSQKERADVELRDLRRANRDLQNFNEWLLFKVEGLFFLLFEDHWEARFEGKHVVAPKRPTVGIRAIAYLLKVGTPEGGPSEVRAIMGGATTAELDSHEQRVMLASDNSLTVITRASQARIDRDDRSREVENFRARVAQCEQQILKIDAEAEERASHLTDEEADRLAAKAKKWHDTMVTANQQIKRLTNHRGRPRSVNYDAHSVDTAIRDGLKKIRRSHPSLGKHLEKAIKDKGGARIRYEPDESDKSDGEGQWKWEVRINGA